MSGKIADRPESEESDPSPEQPSTSGRVDQPTVALIIGMAGSGKTTLMQRINSYLHEKKIPSYILNLDPAVLEVPYGANIDIRDTVKYKNVMKEYGLGPNGGILTSLNLFATRFDQVISLCEKKREPPLQYVLADTPGQIEIFTWSASGQIITESFASTFPTAVLFVVDTPRCALPQTFMSNMLQACSILYKMQLPLLLVFNKTDVVDHQFALEWMKDGDAFKDALDAESSYAAQLSRSLSLVLDEFYENLQAVGVSAVTGAGMEELFTAVDKCREDYNKHYKPELARKAKEKHDREMLRRQQEMEKLRLDTEQAASRRAAAPAAESARTKPC